MRKIWLNDKIVSDAQAKVSIWDRGFLYGDGVYETGRSYDRCFKFVKFFVINMCALLVNLACLFVFTEFFGIYYMVSQLLAIGMGLGVNFAGNKAWTFQKKLS